MHIKNISLKLKVTSFPNNKVNKDMARLNIVLMSTVVTLYTF